MKFDEKINEILIESKVVLTGDKNIDKMIKSLKTPDEWATAKEGIDAIIDKNGGTIDDDELDKYLDLISDGKIKDVVGSYAYLRNTQG